MQCLFEVFLITVSKKTCAPKEIVPDMVSLKYPTLREKCPYSEFFWSVFSCIRTEYGISLHADFLRSTNGVRKKYPP